jgi:RNA recognition motif-containing protein
MAHARENSQQDRRVYVGNLSYDVKWHHLKDFMRQGEMALMMAWKFAMNNANLAHQPARFSMPIYSYFQME